METLPFELLEKIAAFACTDGGRTGCSLSLVSKRFREVARGTRFDSVVLTSGHPSQLTQLLAAYTTARDARPEHGATPRIRHLCVCSRHVRNTRSPDGGPPPPPPPPGDKTPIEFAAVLEQLLRTVAPSLESLALVSPSLARYGLLPVPASVLEKNVWPELRELTVVGSTSALVPPSDSDTSSTTTDPAAAMSTAAPQARLERRAPIPPASPRLPRLTHLHLVFIGIGIGIGIGIDIDISTQPLHLAQWSMRAPRLTHLRVSGSDTIRAYAEELQRAICDSRSTSSGDTDRVQAAAPPPPPPRLFPRLTHLALQPYRVRGDWRTHARPAANGPRVEVEAALQAVQVAFKEVLEHASESQGALKVEMQPPVSVLQVSELGQVIVREWVGGGFVHWAGRDENLG